MLSETGSVGVREYGLRILIKAARHYGDNILKQIAPLVVIIFGGKLDAR